MQRRWGNAVPALALAITVALAVGTGAAGAATHKKASKKTTKSATKKTAGSAADISKGKQLVQASGCMGCHKIGDKGGTAGPELTHVGAHAKTADIAAKIKNPKASKPNSIMPPSNRPDKEISAMAAYLASLK